MNSRRKTGREFKGKANKKTKGNGNEAILAAWIAFVFAVFFLTNYLLSSRYASFLFSCLDPFFR